MLISPMGYHTMRSHHNIRDVPEYQILNRIHKQRVNLVEKSTVRLLYQISSLDRTINVKGPRFEHRLLVFHWFIEDICPI